jgi:hypothetical protein
LTRPDIPTPSADLLARQRFVDLDQVRAVRLCERAMAGDVEAAIEWLAQHDPEWREAAEMAGVYQRW